jgi:hypothetical protein
MEQWNSIRAKPQEPPQQAVPAQISEHDFPHGAQSTEGNDEEWGN